VNSLTCSLTANNTEYMGLGQCAFVDFDLRASINLETGYCNGDVPPPVPDLAAGTYEGRVELIRTTMEDIFGIPSSDPGGPAKMTGPATTYRWALGQVVRVLADGVREPGVHSVSWDGRNVRGGRVSSGVYFYQIDAGPFRATRKMLVVH
jgi:hypothetical protein